MIDYSGKLFNSKKIPYYNKKEVMYKRQERDGFISLMTNHEGAAKPRIINKTCAKVLGLMNGKRTVGDIFRILVEIYGKSNEEQIKTDLEKVILELWQLKIITWKDDDRPMKDMFIREIKDNYTVEVAFENDIRDIISFFKEILNESNFNYYKSPLLVESDSLPLLLRYSLFNMNGVYLMLKKDDEIKGLMVISLPSQNSTVATIDFISSPEKNIKEFMLKAKELFNVATVIPCTKIRINLRDGNPYDNQLGKILEGLGFEKIVLLKNELNNIDINVFDMISA